MVDAKFKLSLSSVAVIAFGFAALRQPTAVLLVCGYALLAEKDSWLNRQAMQALLLTIGYYLAALVTGWIFGSLAKFFVWVKIFKVVSGINTINSLVGDVLYIALIGLSLLAILRVLQEKDARLPFFSLAADGDLSKLFKSPARPLVPQAAVMPPSSQPPQPEGYAPLAPISPNHPAKPVQPSLPGNSPTSVDRLCPGCSSPLQENSRFCVECGTKVG